MEYRKLLQSEENQNSESAGPYRAGFSATFVHIYCIFFSCGFRSSGYNEKKTGIDQNRGFRP